MEKADIIVQGCAILPMDGRGLIEDGALAMKDGRITFVGKRGSATNMRSDLKITARGKVAMPGLINCHTHVPMTLLRGIAEDQPLDKWLKETIWPLEAKLNAEDFYEGSLLGCLEMIKSGTTCFSDMYFQEDIIAKAVEKSGLRAVLAEGIIEAGNETLGETMLSKGVGLVRLFHGCANGRITAMLGPHAAYSCSAELLTRVAEKASELGVGVHLHLAESKSMFGELERACGSSEVAFLDRIGFLKSNVVGAHCINLSDKDRKALYERGVNVAHVPVANMKLGLGAAKIRDLIDLDVNVGLGTDGAASNNTLDMFETMKITALLQKLVYRDPTALPAHQVLRMATINGAKALGLDKSIGSLEVGKKADVILVNLLKPHLKPLHNVFAGLVYAARGSDVDTVIVDGKVLMENRLVKTLDEESVMERSEKTALDLLSR